MFVSQLKIGYFKHPFCEFSYGSNASRDVLRSKKVWLRLWRASGGWGASPPNPLSPSGKAPTRPQKPHPRAASENRDSKEDTKIVEARAEKSRTLNISYGKILKVNPYKVIIEKNELTIAEYLNSITIPRTYSAPIPIITYQEP